MNEKVKIFFDKDYKIRAFDPTRFEKCEELEKECGQFVDKISTFHEKVQTLSQILEIHANRIDKQKLKVSGCSCYGGQSDKIKQKIRLDSSNIMLALYLPVINKIHIHYILHSILLLLI